MDGRIDFDKPSLKAIYPQMPTQLRWLVIS